MHKYLLVSWMVVFAATTLADPIPKDQRNKFMHEVRKKVHEYFPEDSSHCDSVCDEISQWMGNHEGFDPFPLRQNSNRPFKNDWAIFFEDSVGDTAGTRRFHEQKRNKSCSLYLDQDSYGWMKIWPVCDEGLIEEIDHALDSTQATKALILDVRGYSNEGSLDTLYAILGRFIDKPLPGFRFKRRTAGTDTYDTLKTTIKPCGPKPYLKPILIVYDEGWPGRGVPDLLKTRPNTESQFLQLKSDCFAYAKDDIYGLQIKTELPYGFSVWIPTAQVLHPTKNRPEQKATGWIMQPSDRPHPELYQLQIDKQYDDLWRQLRVTYRRSKFSIFGL